MSNLFIERSQKQIQINQINRNLVWWSRENTRKFKFKVLKDSRVTFSFKWNESQKNFFSLIKIKIIRIRFFANNTEKCCN